MEETGSQQGKKYSTNTSGKELTAETWGRQREEVQKQNSTTASRESPPMNEKDGHALLRGVNIFFGTYQKGHQSIQVVS